MPAAPSQVLIVDDEIEIRHHMARAFKGAGMECDEAGDGEDAFQLVSTKPYDAVITDLKMPRRHGHALCLDLMKLPKPPAVMVLTGLSDARLVRELLRLGVYDVAQKPVNYEVLAVKALSMIEYRRSNQRRLVTKPKKTASKKAPNLLHKIETSLIEITELFGEHLDTAFQTNEDLADPPRAARQFIARLAEEEQGGGQQSPTVLPGHEARRSERVTCYTNAVAAPVNRDWKRTGEPFKLALRDLSEDGIRLLHTRAVNSEYLALKWNATQLVAQQIRVVCRIRRCQPLGPFYDFGCQFVLSDS